MKMNWRTDMTLAPRKGYGEGVQSVLIAVEGGRMVVSYWLPQDHTNRSGGWYGLKPSEKPVAWLPIVHPETRIVSLPRGLL